MSEILTESFCERCGTRYTFETVNGRARPLAAFGTPLGALGTLGRGLKRFVVDPDASLDEAFAVARSETEQRQTAHQLEAFHRTFNFCLSCRQYTCADCWNTVEGRCLTCAPLPEPRTIETGDAAVLGQLGGGPGDLAWPAVSLLPEAPTAESSAEPTGIESLPVEAFGIEPEAPGTAEAPDSPTDAGSGTDAVSPEPEAEPEPPPSAARERTSAVGLLADYPPGTSLDDAVAAYDLRMAAVAAPAEVASTEPPDGLAIEAPPSPELSAKEAPEPPGPPATMDPHPIDDEPAPPRAASRDHTVGRATRDVGASLPRAAFPPSAISDGTASAGVMTGGRACPSCGLSLSPSARFCRRCGTPQG